MKQSIFTILLCLLLCDLQAQNTKQKIGFIPYADPSSIGDEGYREMAYEYLYEVATRIFINTQRFDVLDRGKFDIVKLEKEITKGDDFINSEIVAQGNALATDAIVVAKVTALSVSESEIEEGESVNDVGWSAFFTVELKQLDVETTKALGAVQLVGEHKDGGSILTGDAKSPEQAISKAITKIERDLRAWINKKFPHYIHSNYD